MMTMILEGMQRIDNSLQYNERELQRKIGKRTEFVCFSWKDLLPTLLEVLEEEKYINHMSGEVSGSKYKSLIVNNICNSEWDTKIMPSLAKMFR